MDPRAARNLLRPLALAALAGWLAFGLERPAEARRGLPPITKWKAYQALLDALPPSGRNLSNRGKAVVRRIYKETGFVLHDVGPAANPEDHQGWTDREVQRMYPILSALPPQLRDLKKQLYPHGERQGSTSETRWRGYFITRDALNQEEQREHRLAEQRLTGQLSSGKLTAKQRVSVLAQLALVKGFRALNVGSVFGNAYRQRPEIRLYNELLKGSRFPGLKGMLTFTTVHEIAHVVLFKDAKLRAAWNDFYFNKGGQEEFKKWCGYAVGSEDEGWGVGVGTLAAAPELLIDKAPLTHGFLAAHFGETGMAAFAKLRGQLERPIFKNWTERMAIQAVYGLNDLIGGLAKQQTAATATH